jgi:murein DD-endopeptidase MepM/ murein hydrolase activator NlpD
MRPGVARHVNYGSAFGRHQLAIRCSDGTEDFFAHMRWRVADGAHVQAGQKIGEVGVEGNSTGAHIHFERHRSQGHWNCDIVTDPQPSIDWQPPHTPTLFQGGKVYASKMAANVEDSDSVRNLQLRLNDRIGAGLPVTGFYGPATIQACRTFQQSQGWTGANADGIAGPTTIHRLGLVWVEDLMHP